MLVKAGREAGIMVDVEGEGHFYNSISMVLDRHANIEHNLPIAHYHDDVVQLMSRASSSKTPTLVVAFDELYGENFLYQRDRAWEAGGHPQQQQRALHDGQRRLYDASTMNEIGNYDKPRGKFSGKRTARPTTSIGRSRGRSSELSCRRILPRRECRLVGSSQLWRGR